MAKEQLSRTVEVEIRADGGWRRYATATLVVGAFTVVGGVPWLRQAVGTSQLIHFQAVLLAAWQGGLGPGLFATALTVMLAGPVWSHTGDIVRLIVFAVGGILASLLMGSLQAARERARRESARCAGTEATLRRIEATQEAILETAFDCIITLNSHGRVTGLNPVAEQTFGGLRRELMGRGLAELIRMPGQGYGDQPAREGESDDRGPGRVPEVLLGQRMELTGVRADGAEFPVEVAITPTAIGAEGEPAFTAYLRDLSRRKQLEEELRRQARALEDAARRKDEFLAMLAHELRNPLAAINSGVELAARSTDPQDLEWATTLINRNVKHLERLIDDLLDVSRLAHGKIALRKVVVDVATFLDRAVEAIRPVLAQKHQHLDLKVPRGSLWVEGDPTRLEQIVSNLLINAVQYSEERGRIELSAARTDSTEEIVIAVRDQGMGIRPELLPHVFDLFTQGDRTLARTEGGLGIGLTVVKTLIELHGGTVAADSAGPGRGSVFVLRLPAVEGQTIVPQPATLPTSSPSPAPADVEKGPRLGGRILIVDDNVDLTRGLARLLERYGYEVCAAYDGFAAIEAARAHRPEVVLLDIGLPGMDGYEVARRLRLEEGFHDTTLIAITGYGQDEGYRQSRAAGFNHHLIKPVQVDALVSLLSGIEEPLVPSTRD